MISKLSALKLRVGFGHKHQHPDHDGIFKEEVVIIDYLTNRGGFYDKTQATDYYNTSYKYKGKQDDAIIFPFDKDSVMRYWCSIALCLWVQSYKLSMILPL